MSTATSLVYMVNILMSNEERVLTNIELPTDFAEAFQRLAETDEAPETLAECVDAFEQIMVADGVTVSVEEMYQTEPTRHAVQIGGTVEYIPCILDALIIAFLVESKPVEIKSDPPAGDKTIHLQIREDKVHLSTAVFSIGLATVDIQESDLEALDEMEPAVSMASCSYINTFGDEEAYDQWEDQLSGGVVMQLSTDEIITLARHVSHGRVLAEDP